MYTDLKTKKSIIANNKLCPLCSKVFAQKSNRDSHVNIVHSQGLADDFAFDEFDNQHDEQEQNQTMPSMATSNFPKVSPPKFPPITQKRKIPHLTKIKSLNHRV